MDNKSIISKYRMVYDHHTHTTYSHGKGSILDNARVAHEKGLKFDFEGSVVKQINHSFREYGGHPVEYYRFRKVFNPEIIRKEAEETIARL